MIYSREQGFKTHALLTPAQFLARLNALDRELEQLYLEGFTGLKPLEEAQFLLAQDKLAVVRRYF